MTEETKGVKWLYNRRWYYRLHHKVGSNARPLFSDYSYASLTNQMVVCLCHLDRDQTEWRLYTVFQSYIEYLDFIQSLRQVQRSCFEVLTGRQKPHFDLDLNLSEVPNGEDVMLELRDHIIGACIELIPELNLSKDMMFFTSHGPNKRSLHIVINNWYHNDNKEAREFYRQVTEYIHGRTQDKYGERLYQLVDRAVYGENQNFRIVGTHKLGTTRTKLLVPQFTYKGRVYQHEFSDQNDDNRTLSSDQVSRKRALTILRESLVGFVSDSRWVKIEMPKYKSVITDYADLTEHEVEAAMRHCATFDWERGKNGQEKWDAELFEVDKIEGNKIVLKRLLPSYCPLCKRVHDGQNPWIKVFNGHCYWHCRRFQGRTCVHLGKIDKSIESTSESDPETEDLFEPVLSIGGVAHGILSVGGVAQEVKEEAQEKKVVEEVKTSGNEKQPLVTSSATPAPPVISELKKFVLLPLSSLIKLQPGLLSQKPIVLEKPKDVRQTVIPTNIPDQVKHLTPTRTEKKISAALALLKKQRD